MRVFCISDLHLDLWTQKQNEEFALAMPKADVLLIAGDIANGNQNWNSKQDIPQFAKFNHFLSLCSPFYEKIMVVLGNHDFWGLKAYEDAFLNFKDQVGSTYGDKVKLLRNEWVDLNSDYAIFGGTLWYREENQSYYWIDERRADMKAAWKDNESFKKNIVTNPPDKKKIVVSHHLPSFEAVHPNWINDATNDFFVDAECHPIIEKLKPALWLNGHSHEKVDKAFQDTRLLCNPRGYPGEHGEAHIPSLFVTGLIELP